MTREEMLDDLAYARSLAEEGRHAPLIGGAFLVLFGLLLAIAWTAHWTLSAGIFGPMPRSVVGIVWVGFGLCAAIGSVLVGRSVRHKPGRSAIGNRIDRTIWRATAWAILSVVAGTLVAMALRGDTGAPNAIMAAAFGFYGVALLTTAHMSEQRWLASFGALSLAAGSVLWALNDEPWAYLAAALAAILVLVIPGTAMMRHEPKATV